MTLLPRKTFALKKEGGETSPGRQRMLYRARFQGGGIFEERMVKISCLIDFDIVNAIGE